MKMGRLDTASFPRRVYYINLGRIAELVLACHRYSHQLIEDASSEFEELQGRLERGEEDAAKALDELRRRLVLKDVAPETGNMWCVVMHVAAVENYLEDILVVCATIDSSWLKESKQEIPAGEILDAEDLEDLKWRLRRKWAKNWRDGAGPTKWIERFVRFGAREFPDSLATTLEEMWAVRNLVVHDGGVITKKFLARAAAFASQKIGATIAITLDDLIRYSSACDEFVTTIDAWTIKRYPDQMGGPSAG